YGRAILEQPGSIAYQIFDGRLRPLLRSEEYDMPGVSVETADSVDGLARRFGVDPVALTGTIEEFNASIDVAVPFDPTVKDGPGGWRDTIGGRRSASSCRSAQGGTMKAAVLNQQPGELEIEELRVDDPAPGEVLVRTVGAGLCHSDLHFMEGLFRLKVPAVLGHESAGVVEAVGEGVTYVQPGDRVVCCLSIFCGACRQCLSGYPNRCTNPAATSRPRG